MPVLECSRCNELYYSAHGSTELSCDVCDGDIWRLFEDEVSFARVSGLVREPQRGDHAALLYTDAREGAEFCARYLREGLARNERLIVAVPASFRAELIPRLPADHGGAALVLEAEQVYGPGFEPRRVSQDYARMAREQGCPVRVLCGPDPDSAAAIEPDEWRRYERMAHELVLEMEATVLCVYDARELPSGFSPVAGETHPLISRGGADLQRNPDFRYVPAS